MSKTESNADKSRKLRGNRLWELTCKFGKDMAVAMLKREQEEAKQELEDEKQIQEAVQIDAHLETQEKLIQISEVVLKESGIFDDINTLKKMAKKHENTLKSYKWNLKNMEQELKVDVSAEIEEIARTHKGTLANFESQLKFIQESCDSDSQKEMEAIEGLVEKIVTKVAKITGKSEVEVDKKLSKSTLKPTKSPKSRR
jgi:hypothetical protein